MSRARETSLALAAVAGGAIKLQPQLLGEVGGHAAAGALITIGVVGLVLLVGEETGDVAGGAGA